MTEQTNDTVQNEEKAKPGRKPATVKIKNNSARPITLIVSHTPEVKVTVLPTETKEVKKDFAEKIKANKAAMAYFDNGDLVEL